MRCSICVLLFAFFAQPLTTAAFATEVDQAETARLLRLETLDRALAAGKTYLLKNQIEQGSFNYEMHLETGQLKTADNAVRQTGALWGIASLHLEEPSRETRDALRRGLDFFHRHSGTNQRGGKFIRYPSKRAADVGTTGTLALVTLSLIDLLRAEPNIELAPAAEQQLAGYLRQLRLLRREDGLFHGRYTLPTGHPYVHGAPDPYSNGEALLALARAARHLGKKELVTDIVASAEVMYRTFVTEARLENPDSNLTKGFYQWGSMAFYELYASGWPGTKVFGERTVELAFWMIDVHRTLERTRNTAYAYEGLATAWELARRLGNVEAQRKIGRVIDHGLNKLITWQVGGPTPNGYLLARPKTHPLAKGGVMNRKDDPWLRIDVVQHQTHALILTRRFLYGR